MAGVRIDSGQLPMLRDININHQPSRSKVITRWITSMMNAEDALQAIGPILREVEKYKLWELEHYESPELILKAIGINRVVESIDKLPDLIAKYAELLKLGKPVENVVVQIERSAMAEAARMARERPMAGHGGTGANQFTVKDESRVDNINSAQPAKGGTGRDYTLRRLARDRPDLLDRVEAGDLSPNAAAIEAGFRRKLTPLEQIMKLVEKLSAADRAELMDWLQN